MRFCSLKPKYLKKLLAKGFIFHTVYVVHISVTKSYSVLCKCLFNLSLHLTLDPVLTLPDHGHDALAGPPTPGSYSLLLLLLRLPETPRQRLLSCWDLHIRLLPPPYHIISVQFSGPALVN